MRLHGIVFGLCAALPALALNNESWVASYGSDSNPCTRTSPCATLQGAVNATGAGGIVEALDAVDYYPLVIDRAITIEGGGIAMINGGSTVNAITINSGVNGRVIIRDLNLVASGSGGFYGVWAQSSATIENVALTGNFATGIVADTSGVRVGIKNVTIAVAQGAAAYASGSWPRPGRIRTAIYPDWLPLPLRE
jgi:nitrous oxidase accessory protein NosD